MKQGPRLVIVLLAPLAVLTLVIVGVGCLIIRARTALQRFCSVLRLIIGASSGIWCGLRHDTSDIEGIISAALVAICIVLLMKVHRSSRLSTTPTIFTRIHSHRSR